MEAVRSMDGHSDCIYCFHTVGDLCGFYSVGDGGVMRDVEDKGISFVWLLLTTGAMVLFIVIGTAALFEMRGGDKFPPCNEHEGVDCEGK